MAVLLGLLVAASFGSGDFLGGRASRRAPTLTVLMVAQATAVLGAIAVSVFVGARVELRDIEFGALAGCVNIAGLGLLYQGLAVGRMGVVAPLTAALRRRVVTRRGRVPRRFVDPVCANLDRIRPVACARRTGRGVRIGRARP